jgi:murein DD-endopeptidase MepM/ murein hydrolase activator NlpD
MQNKRLSSKKKPQSRNATVMVIDGNKPMTSFEMNTWVLRHGKKMFLGLATTTIVLAIGLTSLSLKQVSTTQENIALSEQVKTLENFNSAEAAAKINELKKTESTVNALQNYLLERGINPDGTLPSTTKPPKDSTQDNQPLPMGGAYRPISAQTPYGSQFNQRATSIFNSIKNVPLGLPHTGEITSTFGNRSNPFSGDGSEDHSGIDFRGTIGEPIQSTADGVVVQAGAANGYGYAIKIAHGHKFETLYGHLSAIDVSVGQKVKAGDVIGKLGNTGRSTGPHLHYEVRQAGTPIDPEDFLQLK